MSDAPNVPASTGTAAEPKVIKRYTNRKLYDTVESRYVTLEEIADMVKSGAEVKIVDNRTKEDLTSVTLAQIIFEEEKKTSKMPLGMLRDIIRTGGDSVQAFLAAQVAPRVEKLQAEAEHLRERFFKKEDGTIAEVPPEPEKADAKSRLSPKELMQLSTKTVEDWQRKLDDRIKAVVESMTSLPALAKDLHELEKKITELEKKIEELK
ncbi:MAG: polyhydroxyalkanoate synthesis regulator DNA-binding domain-containing protein [Deltaproteobacteria bacterium]|nr:polyhydroxyalkanoate synthesis regulator DNA-binding domain-containing protein [Deltaproteobacteria bacterium]